MPDDSTCPSDTNHHSDDPDKPYICPDGETDPAFMLAHSSVADPIRDISFHYFFQSTLAGEPVDWDCVMMYILTMSGSHCEDIRDSMADTVQYTFTNMVDMYAVIKKSHTWVSQEPVDAFKAHFERCYPTFNADFQQLSEAE